MSAATIAKPSNGWRWPGLAVILATLLFCFNASAATAVTAAPPHISAEIPTARLAGQGNYRWFGLKLYDARLWVGTKGFRQSAPDAEKFALDLQYARALYGKKIAQASIDEMKSVGVGTAAQHAIWLQKMEQIFPDVTDGTHLTGVNLPGIGVRFYRDGKMSAELLDPAFAHAFFSIWLDPKTSAKSLRDALLMDAAPHP